MMTPEQKARRVAALKFFEQQATFVMGCVKTDHLPTINKPEVAFAGRSNVGKSSLINALTRRKDLARASNTPGRTREINFFDLGAKIHLVDLPGYGYAEASKTKIAAWNQLMIHYLKGRPTLRRVFILIDSRMGLKKIDEAFMKLLDETAVPYQIVLTKGDKVKEPQQKPLIEGIETTLQTHGAAHPKALITSSLMPITLDDLKTEIYTFTENVG